MNKKFLLSIIILSIVALGIFKLTSNKKLPVIAIANWGSHSSLQSSIIGFKRQMRKEGFIENETINYKILDVNFEPSLIPQMIINLKSEKPKVMMVMSTPVAQVAKGMIKNIPIVYNVITDPVKAGLIKEMYKSYGNITGSSDMQDLKAFLKFVVSLLPKAKKIGLLYTPSESNDVALVSMMRRAASHSNMSVLAIPVEQARDVPLRVQAFKGKVDFIYVGTSGPIQPTLPAIVAEANKMKIPVFNVDAQAVKDSMVLASFGVDYVKVGENAGKLTAAILKGRDIANLRPIYPKTSDHYGIINRKLAKEFAIKVPKNIEVVG